MHPLQRLHFVAPRYPHLQGLRLIPQGIPFLISAMWRMGQFHWVPGATTRLGPTRWFMVLMAVAVGVALMVGRGYRERFGVMRTAPSARGVIVASVFVAAMVAALWIQQQIHPPLLLPVFVIGLALAYIGSAGGVLRAHYLVVSAFVVWFAFLGPLALSLSSTDIIFDELVGLGLIVIGVGDHRFLVRAMEPDVRVNAI